MPLGSLPLDPLARDRRRQRPRRILPAQQGRSERLAAAGHAEPRAGCARQGAADAERQGPTRAPLRLPGDPRRDGEQADQRGVRPRFPEEQFLAVLAYDVRVRGVAFGPGDETLSPPLHPPHRPARRLLVAQVQPVQSVRVDGPAAGQVAAGSGRPVPLRRSGHRHRFRDRRRTQAGDADRLDREGRRGRRRSWPRRSGVHHHRVADRKFRQRRPSDPGQAESRPGARLGPVAAHRGQGPGLRTSRRVRGPYCADQMGVGDHHHARRAYSAVHPQDRQARSVQRQGGHRRHRHGQGFELAAELDGQPPAPFQEAAEGPARGLVLRPVRRSARRLCEKADAGLHWRGDHPGMALSPRRPGRGYRRSRGERRQDRAGDDALYHRLLHAPPGRRPAGRGPGGGRQFRLHRPVRRVQAARLHLHHGVFGPHADGGGLHAARCRARRARSVQLDL